MSIEHTTDLHIVTHQLYVIQQMTDILHITYVNPTEPTLIFIRSMLQPKALVVTKYSLCIYIYVSSLVHIQSPK